MDSARFDRLVKSLGTPASRRTTLGVLLAALLAPRRPAPAPATAAKGKGKGKDRGQAKPSKPQPAKTAKKCRQARHPCEGNQQCCAGLVCVVSGPGAARRCTPCDVCDDEEACLFQTVQAAINAATAGDTITICKGTFDGNVTVDKNLTLRGAGAEDTKLEGENGGSVVTIAEGVTATIQAVTISDGTGTLHEGFLGGGGVFNLGTLTLIDAAVVHNQAQRGGGILNAEVATLTLDHTSVADNTAVTDLPNDLSFGGGIHNLFGGDLTIRNGSVVVGNRADQSGGLHNNGILHMFSSAVRDNNANVDGGGMINDSGGQLTLNGTIIQNNRADLNGGGLFIVFGPVVLENGTAITRNQAGANGGGMFNQNRSPVRASDSAIGENVAGADGGGIFNIGQELTLVNTSVSRTRCGSRPAFTRSAGEPPLHDEVCKTRPTRHTRRDSWPQEAPWRLNGI